jgi:catechol 2,3-dioxygenase-like lactoylglutathione lyase family enzyme
MSKTTLHHIELYVSDLQRSKEFWGWLLESLGYKPFREWDSGFSWACDSFYIVLVQVADSFSRPHYHRKRVGLNHIAFNARSRKHVDDIVQMLLERGSKLLYADKHPYAGGEHHYALYCEDPDRIKIEIVAPDIGGTS